MSEIDFNGNTRDNNYETLRLVTWFGSDAGALPIYVRVFLPKLRKYGQGRQDLLSFNELPLKNGQSLNSTERFELGDPVLPWADQATVDRNLDKAQAEANKDLPRVIREIQLDAAHTPPSAPK